MIQDVRSAGNAHDCSPKYSRRMLPRLDHGLSVVAGMRAYHAAVRFLDRGRDKLPTASPV